MSSEDERKFLHDLANPLSILQSTAKITLRKMEQHQLNGEAPNPQEFRDRLQKILSTCDKLAATISERRAQLQAEEDR